MKTLRITSAALAIIAAAVLACGCKDKINNYDYDLIGGDTQNSSGSYDVDIRKDPEGEPGNSSDTTSSSASTTNTNSGTESKPDVTSKPAATSSSTVIKVPETPKKDNTSSSDTTSSTTSTTEEEKPQSAVSKPENKPEESKNTTTSSTPAAPSSSNETKLDKNGFPANPVADQTFYDSTGQKWIYSWMFGWKKTSDDRHVVVEDFPRSGNYTYGEGEIILH